MQNETYLLKTNKFNNEHRTSKGVLNCTLTKNNKSVSCLKLIGENERVSHWSVFMCVKGSRKGELPAQVWTLTNKKFNF